uniref:Uncharacterized protein n=1 Tax=Rhizophora mucronata TaxID=61149 RepID=A0A2P2MXH5_RHIMU
MNFHEPIAIFIQLYFLCMYHIMYATFVWILFGKLNEEEPYVQTREYLLGVNNLENDKGGGTLGGCFQTYSFGWEDLALSFSNFFCPVEINERLLMVPIPTHLLSPSRR